MRTTLILLTLAASLQVACNQSSAPAAVAAKSGDVVTQKLQEQAGSGATDCGRIKSQEPDKVKSAGDCAMQAAKDKRPFYVAYDMPGLTAGYAGNAEGKLFSVQSEQPEAAGAKPEIKSAPCPGELRFAQSGRVTCMMPGSMGGAGTSPHGGMPPATGANPHGGMMDMPNLGTPNPQGAPQPSHPPASKTPPKQ